MTTTDLLLRAWEWHPSIVVGCIVLLLAYLVAVRFRFSWKAVSYSGGVVVLLLTLVGPLDVLGEEYLFSAHMLEHMVLMFIVPPLLLAGVPEDLTRRLLRNQGLAGMERVLGQPVVAWFVGVGTLWVWHAPSLYNAALQSEAIHIVQHLTMLVAGVIFWWPILAPEARFRLSVMWAISFLFTAAVSNTVLGVLLTNSSVKVYPMYIHPPDELGGLSLIRDGWGIDAQADLMLGGLFMWVLGGLVFLWAILVVFVRWFANPESEESSGQTNAMEAAGHGG
jgi:putative membrane protein